MMTIAEDIVTAEQLLDMPDLGPCELICGEVVMMSPSGYEHGVIAGRIHTRLATFVEQHSLGIVTAAETGFQIGRDPDTVRAADVGFIRADRVPPVRSARLFSRGARSCRGSGVARRPRRRSAGKGARLALGRLSVGLGGRSHVANDLDLSRLARTRHVDQRRRTDRRHRSSRLSPAGDACLLIREVFQPFGSQ